MPNFSVLHDISQTLQLQIVAALTSAPDVNFDVTTETLPLSPPSDDLDPATVAVLYLFHVSIDPHLRNQSPIPDTGNPSLFIRPPLPLLLKYLFVPLDAAEENNQLMLGRVLQYFHDAPTIRPVPGSPLATSRGGLPDHLRVRPDFAGFEALSQLWSALSRPFRLSAGFMVDIVGVDSAEPATVAPRIGTTFTVNRKLTEGAS